MLELGLKDLIVADAGVLAIAPDGGYLLSLPADFDITGTASWTHKAVTERTEYTLTNNSFRTRHIDIDCFSADPDKCLDLAEAIDKVLDGYKGTLSDPDATVVFGCFRSGMTDFFDDAGRTVRRVLEYEIQFCSS